MAPEQGNRQWTGRPWVARAIRLVVYLVPFAASIGFAWLLSGWLPPVTTVPAAIVRWLLIAAASTGVMIGFDRLSRRLLPLAALYGLTLAFPDQAPSRFKVAMRTGTTLHLRKAIADARAGRIGDTPAEAAERLLELVGALSLHDRLTRGHSERVRAYTHLIGEELGVTGTELDRLRWAALLHDIGKLLVAAEILNKPGRLTSAEFDVIKQHPEFGRELVAPLTGWLGPAAHAVWEHHERWDGGGYPRGLAGTDISFAARVVAVADAFDVMTSARSYKQPMPAAAARAELARCAGSHFDAAVVRAFLNVSLGRLRMAMGPLSWLTQLSFVPQALVTASASGATAVTAVVGLGAGAIGVGLGDDGMISAPVVEAAGDPTPGAVTATSTGGGRGLPGPAPGDPPPDTGDPGDHPPGGTGDPGGRAGAARPTTTTGPSSPTPSTAGGGTTTTIGTATTVPSGRPTATTAPPRGATTTSSPPAPGGGTAVPPSVPGTTTATTTATTAPATTAPTAPGPGTTAPTTAPPTTAPLTPPPTSPPTTLAPTTTAPPAVMSDLALYLTSPGSGAVASQAVLPLSTTTPTALLVPNYDTNRNDDPGLTLRRGIDQQRFRSDPTAYVHFTGTFTARLFVSGAGLLNTAALVVDAQLQHCSGGTCVTLATRQGTAPGPLLGLPLLWGETVLAFGAIDTVLAAGDTLDLVVSAPATSSRDVWLAYDATVAPSRIIFAPT